MADENTAGQCEDAPDLNHAYLHGTEPEGLADFLEREATFLLGQMYGQRDRRNTQDGHWQSLTLTWGAWIGGQAGSKVEPTWGFSRHPVGKQKEGAAIVLGSSVGGARKAKAMDTMYAMGLDVDSGASLDDTLDKIEEMGLLCFAYTSYRHGLAQMELKRDEVLRKLQIKGDPTLGQVQTFLRDHDKHRYEDSFIAGCTIKEQKHQTTEGVKIVLDTPPLDKFRLIFPLAEPVKLIELADTQAECLTIWEDKVTGLARNTLGVHFDTSCTDPSRLFFTARHPKSAKDWYCAIVQGNPLSFDNIPPMRKAACVGGKDDNAFTQAGGETAGTRPPQCYTPSGKNLNVWHRDAKDRFMMADLLEAHCADKIRVAGNEAQGHVHIECPFEGEHTEEGGTATMAINCLDAEPSPSGESYWTIFCHHDACQGRHKLQFLEEMLRQGWFDESALFDTSEGFMLEVEDGETDPLAPLTAELGDEELSPVQRAAQFNHGHDEETIRKFIKKLFREGADKTVRGNVTAAIAKNTNLTKHELKAFWKELDETARKRAEEEKTEGAGVVGVTGFSELVVYADRCIHEGNREFPKVFHYARDLCMIREDSNGQSGIHTLNRGGFEHHLNTVARFVRNTENDPIEVAAPDEVVRHLFNADYGKYPSLRGIITTPSFTAAGALLTEPGYDWGTKLFFQPDYNLSIPHVSDVPSAEEVFEAKRLLVQEILSDFMLDGMDRAETIRKVLGCEEAPNLRDDVGEDVYALPVLLPIPGATPEPTPSLAHAVVMAVFPFVRDMIPGNAPGIAIDKQKPGAGAGKLEAAMSTIYSGRGTPAMALPTNPEDMTKVLLPALRSGRPNVFFDNINAAVDSGELASAMTAPAYEARILGKSETVEVEVRCQWVGAGNKIRLSDELIRRFVLIYLDPKTANPEKRTGFRHAEIEAWVRENRGSLVWACLTLVQNWIAGGRQPGNYNKASYSAWARTMGGILDAAGIKGFLGNEKDMKARSSVSDDPVQQLLARVAEFGDGQLFVTGTVAKRHPEGTQSVKAILEGFHEDEEGDAQALRLPGWGYDPFGIYSNAQKLGSGFKRDVASEPHKVGDWEVSFEPVENASGVKLWKLVKRAA